MNLKNISIYVLLAILVIPVGLGAQNAITGTSGVTSVTIDTLPAQSVTTNSAGTFTQTLKKGDRGSEVKDLQEILKSDSAIYPEGLVTGYYGDLTTEALKRLQQRYGIPVTGVLDEATRAIIFPPQVELKIITPNGGEVWDKSQLRTILWKSSYGPVVYNGRELVSASQTTDGTASSGSLSIAPQPDRMPFYHLASLELTKDSNPSFHYYIGSVNLFDSRYNWNIPARIPEGKDYRVRISIGRHVPCLYDKIGNTTTDLSITDVCPAFAPSYYASDSSDRPFAITGSAGGGNDEIIRQLKEQISVMEQQIGELQRRINMVKELLGKLM